MRSGFWRWESWQTGADGNEATQLPNRPPSASDSVGNVSTGKAYMILYCPTILHSNGVHSSFRSNVSINPESKVT